MSPAGALQSRQYSSIIEHTPRLASPATLESGRIISAVLVDEVEHPSLIVFRTIEFRSQAVGAREQGFTAHACRANVGFEWAAGCSLPYFTYQPAFFRQPPVEIRRRGRRQHAEAQ